MEAVGQLKIDNFINADNIERYVEQYRPNDMLVIENFMSTDSVTQHYLPEVEKCTPFIHRVKVPKFKKSGSVSRHLIKQQAPNLFSLYQSVEIKQFVEAIVGETLCLCPDDDPHAVALYYYTEPGDRIGVHYDKSFYKGKRYTVLLGMIQDSTESKLVCYPGSTKRNRRQNPVEIYTNPGTLVIFNGDRLWHEVTALGHNERRVILTMEYLTDPRISFLNRMVSNIKDRYLYFGKERA